VSGYLDQFNRQGVRVSIRQDGKLWFEPAWLVTDGLLRVAHDRRDELVHDIRRNSKADESSEEIAPDYQFLMVATDLDSWETDDPRFGYELNCDPVYRMLDASYYAWLRHRMENARAAHGSGRLDDQTFETLRERFNIIHDWALRHIGEEALKQAIRTTNVKTYAPPSEQTFAAYRRIWDDAWNAHQQRQAAHNKPNQSDQARRLQHLLDTQGYAGIRSSIIDDIVVFVRDDSVALPAKWASKVTYTMDELALMVGSSPEAVKQIHDVKRIFGGKVVPQDESDAKLFVEHKPSAVPSSAPQLTLECAV